MKRTVTKDMLVAIGLVGAVAAGALAQGTAAGPAVKPGAVAKRAATPPPASATKTQSAGKKQAKASTANAAGDSDSFWIEQIDVDGDGNAEDSNLVWDDEDKVLFAYAEDTFTCRNGGTAVGELLIATNGPDNPRKRPAGSGFWVASLDEGECGAAAAALVGCRFDAAGKETACGIVTVDEANDDIVIVTAQR